MTMLRFSHEGYDVLTSAWTAASEDGVSVDLCYQWGANGFSFASSATGVRRITLPVTMREFLRVVSSHHGRIADFSGLGDIR